MFFTNDHYWKLVDYHSWNPIFALNLLINNLKKHCAPPPPPSWSKMDPHKPSNRPSTNPKRTPKYIKKSYAWRRLSTFPAPPGPMSITSWSKTDPRKPSNRPPINPKRIPKSIKSLTLEEDYQRFLRHQGHRPLVGPKQTPTNPPIDPRQTPNGHSNL